MHFPEICLQTAVAQNLLHEYIVSYILGKLPLNFRFFLSRPAGKNTMNAQAKHVWDGNERRQLHSCRRVSDRRANQERRFDRRNAPEKHSRSFYGWLRSLAKARLGVDRRKNFDQRIIANRRSFTPRSMLTREELADLLK
jgi:hypothetical protein